MILNIRHVMWIAMLVVALLLLWLLREVLVPFLAGMAIAYALDPAIRRLERWGIGRAAGAACVIFIFFAVVIGTIALLAPVLEQQSVELVQRLVNNGRELLDWGWQRFHTVFADLGLPEPAGLSGGADAAKTMVGWLGSVIAGVWSGGFAVINILTLLVITPVVAFYLLRDWPKVAEQIDALWPRDHAITIRELLRRIDFRLAGFVRGQALVCLLVAAYYGIALTAVGLANGLIIGLIGGLLTFIPYLGTAATFIVGLTIAFFQYDSWLWIGIVAGILIVGQMVEGNFLSPVLVGGRIGLHPVWLMFALMAGGALFGFVGILLAVPVAAALGVLARFALEQYHLSAVYRGEERAP
jgi:predicted PurR-regulated permease PerM